MSLLDRFTKRSGPARPPRVCCIGLDGTPCSLLERAVREGIMPNMAGLLAEGTLRQMNSVHPWLSSVAWTTLQTGVNPAKHGIYGFIDRDPATMKPFIPLANRIKYPAVWDLAGQAGKRVIVLNVPVTYPVAPVNGIMVSGFLAPKLNEKAVYPNTQLQPLEALGYRVDTDPLIARQDRDKALDDIRDALQKRTRAFLHYMDTEPWDYFLGVIMETDRLHHFFYEQMEVNDPIYAPAFWDIYGQIDTFLGQVRERLDDQDTLMMMSDHGFCSIRQEVFYNRWLADCGYLKYTEQPAKGLEHLHHDSVAYDLDPGRIFVNLAGREATGRVQPGAEYERLRDELIEAVEGLMVPANERDNPPTGGRPDNIQPVLKAYRREELYVGPYLEQAADIILAPRDGYDPKGTFYPEGLYRKDAMMVGMHSFDTAFVYVNRKGMAQGAMPGQVLPRQVVSILDIAPTMLTALNLSVPNDYDGASLI
jgi:predicted AlkP superfamily phosphohydrolase/phosphomutase